MSRLEEIDAQIAALQIERATLAQSEGPTTVYSIVRPLFDYPGVENIYWTQYTPYFNDGDPCTFGVYFEPYINYNVEEGGDPEDEEAQPQCFDTFGIKYTLQHKRVSFEDASDYDKQHYNRERWEAEQNKYDGERAWFSDAGWTLDLAESFKEDCDRIAKWINKHQGFLFDAFGDHCYVVINSDGTHETDEYDHG